jgi:site-specific DNA recombinase
MTKKGKLNTQFKGRITRAENGFKQGGPAPYGYGMTGRTRENRHSIMIVDEKESLVVKEIFRLYNELNSLRAVARELESKSLKTRRDKQWSIAGLAYIIRNPAYIGKCSFGKIKVSGKHKSIIDEEVFKKAQDVIGRKRQKTKSRKVSKSKKVKEDP